MHARDFGRESKNEQVAEQLIYDYRTADLNDADRALCDYAVKLTLTPHAMTQQDIDRLRGHGFGDDAITIAVQVIGYFNYINRVAEGLDVDDQPCVSPSRDEWDRKRNRDHHAAIERADN